MTRGLVGKIVSGGMLAFLGIFFVLQLVPEFETLTTAFESTSPFVETLAGISIWAVPAALLVAIVVAAVNLIGSR